MLIWQSHVNANMKPAAALSSWGQSGCCMYRSVLAGGAGRWWGQLSGDHPKQGPNSQLEGLRRRHVALTDQIFQIAPGRTGCPLADGKRDISPAAEEPPPPPYITLQNPSLSHFQTLLHVFTCLLILLSFGSSAGSKAMFKTLFSSRWALNLKSCQDFVDPFSPDRHYNRLQLLLVLFHSVIQ